MPTEDGTVADAARAGHRPPRERDVSLVPVLRAGLGMLAGVLELLPGARVGHIGLQRDEATAMASRYYSKLPPRIDDELVLMIDPMLATGGSAVAALDICPRRRRPRRPVRVHRRRARRASPRSRRRYPEVPIYTPVVDRD